MEGTFKEYELPEIEDLDEEIDMSPLNAVSAQKSTNND